MDSDASASWIWKGARPSIHIARSRVIFLALCLGSVVTASAYAQGVDRSLVQALKNDGLAKTKVAATATELADTIGPRLTWSLGHVRATKWAQRRLAALIPIVHLESIDETGLGWQQKLAWLRMTSPDEMMVQVQASPWSVGSGGTRSADAVAVTIATIEDIAKYRGRLSGKIVLLGPAVPPDPAVGPFLERFDTPEKIDAELVRRRNSFRYRPTVAARWFKDATFRNQLADFLRSEHPAAVVVPSTPMPGGGDTGLLAIDEPFAPANGLSWKSGKRLPMPVFVATPEGFGRIFRLADEGQRVSAEWHLDVEEAPDQVASNVIGDWPGRDPKLINELLVVGAHLDSWTAGTGAVDDGAGVAIVLEAIRLLREAGYKPRRTIRVVLYAGEEQGLFGAQAYAAHHLGTIPRAGGSDQLAIPIESWRQPAGPLSSGSEWARTIAVINVDDGAGRVRGVFTGGNNPAYAAQLKRWIAPLADLGVTGVYDQSTWPADNWVYTSIGLPTLTFLQDPLDYNTRAYHTNMDTAERLSPEDMAQASVTLATMLATMADSYDRPVRPPIPDPLVSAGGP